jgi:hypothetical protein
MNKVKFQELVQEVAGDVFKEAIGVAKPKYKGKSDQELAEIMGLSEYQYNHFKEKALGNTLGKALEAKIIELLKNHNSIEVAHAFNVFVHESSARKNENGTSARKLSIRTRQALKRDLND